MKMFETWFPTVLRLMKSNSAISLLLRPQVFRVRISSSRVVSSAKARTGAVAIERARGV